ncbi:MAG: CBS domain-containing protein [Desulfobacterales bacterium]
MKSKTVKDLMVPLSEYATVSEDATLYEAVMALRRAQEEFDQTRDRHRAILVYNKFDKIVGKISQLDVLHSLEPKYGEMGDGPMTRFGLSRYGFSPKFMRTMMSQFNLWEKSLEESCRIAGKLKVKDIMYTPTLGEFVEDTASLSVAIHQLLLGHHQSLLVTRRRDIVGILRLTDVFREVSLTFERIGKPG